MANRSFGELKRLARESLISNYITPILAMLTASFLPAAVLAPFSAGVSAELNPNLIIYVVAAVIIRVLGRLLAVGVARMHLMLARKQPLSYKELFWPFRDHPDRFILATLLLYGILLVPAVPAAVCMFFLAKMKSASGYVLLAFAAIALAAVELYLSYMFELIYPLYIDRPEMPVIEGLRTSAALMRGNKMRFFRLHLSFLGWQVLGICSAGIGLLWIEPYITQTTVNFYLDIVGQFDKNEYCHENGI